MNLSSSVLRGSRSLSIRYLEVSLKDIPDRAFVMMFFHLVCSLVVRYPFVKPHSETLRAAV